MTREFVRLFEFEKQCKAIDLIEDDVKNIENIILDNPTVGDVMPGTGGVRKFRYALPNTGKRGGARIVYVDFPRYEKTHFLTVYAKSKSENLTKEQQNKMRAVVALLEAELRRERNGR